MVTQTIATAWATNIDMNAAKHRATKVLQQIKQYQPHTKTVLELGVGLGSVLYFFPKKYAVYGLDLSQHALKIATKTIPNARLFHSSMHNFRLPRTYDVIFTVNECINEVKPYKNWESTFHQVYQHLNQHGLFIFDMPTQHYLDWHKKRIVKLEKVKSGYIFDNTIVQGNKLTWDTTYFHKLKNGQYQVEHDKYSEYIYPLSKVEKSLKKYFTIVTKRYDNHKRNLLLVCRKK